jgi:hypothetical protein
MAAYTKVSSWSATAASTDRSKVGEADRSCLYKMEALNPDLRKQRGHQAEFIAMVAGLAGCAVSLAACDGAFRLRGELVVDARGKHACELRLHNASDGAVLRRRSVSGTFLELFTVSVVPRDY